MVCMLQSVSMVFSVAALFARECRSHERRAVDLPIQGCVKFTSEGVEFFVHRNIPRRIKKSKPGGPERIDKCRAA